MPKGGIEITIPEFRLAEIRIIGVTPLMTNRFSEHAKAQIRNGQTGKVVPGKKPPRDPVAEFHAAIHRTRDGRYALNATAIKEAMVVAGQRFADGKRTELRGLISIPMQYIPIEHPDGPVTPNPEPPPDPEGWPAFTEEWVVHGGANRTTSLAYRPAYSPWEMLVPIKYLGSHISLSQIVQLLAVAGMSVGIGCWRPENKGIMGQFSVAETITDERLKI